MFGIWVVVTVWRISLTILDQVDLVRRMKFYRFILHIDVKSNKFLKILRNDKSHFNRDGLPNLHSLHYCYNKYLLLKNIVYENTSTEISISMFLINNSSKFVASDLDVIIVFQNYAFPDTWIRESCPILWPTRSPELRSIDFYVWGLQRNYFVKQWWPIGVRVRNWESWNWIYNLTFFHT